MSIWEQLNDLNCMATCTTGDNRRIIISPTNMTDLALVAEIGSTKPELVKLSKWIQFNQAEDFEFFKA